MVKKDIALDVYVRTVVLKVLRGGGELGVGGERVQYVCLGLTQNFKIHNNYIELQSANLILLIKLFHCEKFSNPPYLEHFTNKSFQHFHFFLCTFWALIYKLKSPHTLHGLSVVMSTY